MEATAAMIPVHLLPAGIAVRAVQLERERAVARVVFPGQTGETTVMADLIDPSARGDEACTTISGDPAAGSVYAGIAMTSIPVETFAAVIALAAEEQAAHPAEPWSLTVPRMVAYFIANKDLGLSPGKLSAQVAHAASLAALRWPQRRSFRLWMARSFTKIVLGAHEAELRKAMTLFSPDDVIPVHDNGLTEVPAGTLTCVGIIPLAEGDVPKFVRKLRLYPAAS